MDTGITLRRSRVALTPAVGIMLLLAACGDPSTSVSPEIPVVSTPIETVASTPTLAPAPAEPARFLDLPILAEEAVVLPDGSSIRTTIAVGPTFAFDGTHPDWEAVLSPCAVDTARDAFIPVRMVIQNTTDGFAINGLEVKAFFGTIDEVMASGEAGEGCWDNGRPFESEDNYAPFDYFGDIPAGELVVEEGGIVLLNFFNPNQPEGGYDDPRYLMDISITPREGRHTEDVKVVRRP